MYELFLTLRYLTRKAIVVFPILVVWLCVMMMIIVTSIMGGFVDRVREANRELMGDIIVDARMGFAYYDELQAELKKLPNVEATTPVVRAYGLINLVSPLRGNAPAQIVGIDPAGRAHVSRFRQTLFRHFVSPDQAADDLARGGLPADTPTLQERARKGVAEADATEEQLHTLRFKILRGETIPGGPFNWAWLLVMVPVLLGEWLLVALTRDKQRWWRKVWIIFPLASAVILVALAVVPMLSHKPSARDAELLEDRFQQAELQGNRARRTERLAKAMLPAGQTFHSRQELVAALVPADPSFAPYPPLEKLPDEAAPPADPGCIVGVDIGLFPRDRRGNYSRPLRFDNARAVLTVAPISARGTLLSGAAAQQQPVVIVDDSYSKVFDVDSTYVYAPFSIVQKMALMHQQVDEETGETIPARANEVQIKIRNGNDTAALRAARQQVQEIVDRMSPRWEAAGQVPPTVQTWDEKQARYIEAVMNEKRMITFILGLMSLVVLVVIFLIFYMIVREKTRDIGIIKAIGGSEWGVANIFMMYGGFIGIIGGLLGVACGVAFVLHTNEIHEWIYQTTGILIWNRSVYLFDRIPDQVNPWEVALYFGLSVVAGWFGALLPSLVAGFQNPVRALRHE